MKIHAYAICWNEEKMLPYYLNHYSKFCDQITIFDNESTDSSREIIQSYPNTTIETYSTNGEIRDDIYLEIKNSCWKKSRGVANYVIVGDIDEILYHEDIVGYLKQNHKHSVFDFKEYEMVSENFPEHGGQIYDEVKRGRAMPGTKRLIFDPNDIEEINYEPGCHVSKPKGQVNIKHDSELKFLHYKHLSLDYIKARYKTFANRLSKGNRDKGWGFHYTLGEKDIEAYYDNLLLDADYILPNLAEGNTSTPEPRGVSFVITSCGRWDLLQDTLDTFLATNTYPIAKYIITEDSGKQDMVDKIKGKYGHLFSDENIIFDKNSPKQGIGIIDKAYSKVETEFIFHCEDDWHFHTPSNYIEQSIDILDYNPMCLQVWLRDREDMANPSIAVYTSHTNNGTEYYNVYTLDVWTGFSWNPGLRRKSDYDSLGEGGYKHTASLDKEYNGSWSLGERAMAFHYTKTGHIGALLANTHCYHTGDGRHVF